MRHAFPITLMIVAMFIGSYWFGNADEHYSNIQHVDTQPMTPGSTESGAMTVTAMPELILTGILSVNDKNLALIRVDGAPAHAFGVGDTVLHTLVVAEINQHSVIVKDTVAMNGWELELMTQSAATNDSYVQITTAAQTDIQNDNDAPSPYYGYNVINGMKVVAMDLEPGQSRTFYQPPRDNEHTIDEDANRPAPAFDPGQTVTVYAAPPEESYLDEDNEQLASSAPDNTGQSVTFFAPPPKEEILNQRD